VAVVVIDTDVASRLHRRDVPPEVARVLVGATIVMTFVSVAELLQWPELRSWGEPRRRRLEGWLTSIPVRMGTFAYRVGGAPIQHGALGRRVRRCGSVRTELIQGRPYELFDLSGVPPGVT
jgi:hypothetical protein